MSRFAPTPTHGAAYAVAIEAVGGINAIGDCSTDEAYAALRARLNDLEAWVKTQEPPIQRAYGWAIAKVDSDAKARLEIHLNSRKVQEAYRVIPRPGKEAT